MRNLELSQSTSFFLDSLNENQKSKAVYYKLQRSNKGYRKIQTKGTCLRDGYDGSRR